MANGIILNKSKIISGIYEAQEECPSNSMKEYSIQFGMTFPMQPVVVANTFGTYNPNTEMTPCNVSYIDGQHFRVRVFNKYSSPIAPKITWIATMPQTP